MPKGWYKINNAVEVPEILIYGDIAEYGITAKDFRNDLFALEAEKIKLRIASRGGYVDEGVAIFNAIKEHPAWVAAHIDSLAASIASFITMAADRVVMAKNSRMMIHKAWGIAIGNSEEMQKMAERLDDTDTILVDTYAERTGIAKREIRQMLAAETWFTPKQAKELGFIDEIAGEGEKNQFDLSPFSNVPDDVMALYGKSQPTKRDVEQLLRDAGVSRAAAKRAVAAIDGQRDADVEEVRALLEKNLSIFAKE